MFSQAKAFIVQKSMGHFIVQNKDIRKAKITYLLRHRIYNKHVQASEKAVSSQKPAGLPVKMQ